MENTAERGPSTGIRRLATIATYASHLGVALLGLANVLLVSRGLGPSGRGQVAFLTTVATISGYLTNLSVHEANANFSSRGDHLRRVLGSNSLVLALVFSAAGAVAAATALAYLPFLSKDVSSGDLAIALASIPAATLQTYMVYLARGAYFFTAANVALVLGPTMALAGNLAMVAVGHLSVTGALASWTIGNALSATVLVAHHYRRTGFGMPQPVLAREAVGFGLKSHIGGIFATGSYSLDQWILGAAAGSTELGLYSVAVAWFQGLFLLPMAVGAVARPDIVRLSGEDAAVYVTRLVRVTLAATAALSVGVFILAPILCTTIFGGAFRGAVGPLRLLVPGALGVCTVKMLGMVLIAQGKPLRESAAMGAGFTVAIVLYLTLIPAYGGMGAAIASTIAYSVAGVSAAVLVTRTLPIAWLDLIPRPSDFRRALSVVATRRIH